MARPMLDELELQQVQTIEVDGDQVWTQHGIPALEGDFFQGLGRRASQVTLTGVLTGAEVADNLKKLRDKFRAAAPVSFVADIATATRLDQVLIEEMGVREVGGRPSRFEYAFTLREFIPATPTEIIIPPPPPPPPPPPVEQSTLEVEVIVEGDESFDHANTRIRVEGFDENGQPIAPRELPNDPPTRQNNLWTVFPFPAGNFTATATTASPVMSGSDTVVLPLGQTQRAVITLRQGQTIATAFMIHYWFDRAFVEPCMRHVLRQVADFAAVHKTQKLIIVGHTDESGDPNYNQSLSERRARGAHAYLTFGRDLASGNAAVAEWNELRKSQSGGGATVRDNWGARQYQHMLQDLGFYNGQINGIHNAATDQAVRDFQAANGLTVDGDVGDLTWPVLIRAYMAQDNLAVPENQLMPNAKGGCDNGFVHWMGCGEKMTASSPTPPMCSGPEPAWRPNRRTELLFVRADRFPCDIPEPVTFKLAPVGGAGWCLGPGNPNERCCFITHNANEQDKFLVQTAEPGTFVVNGRIQFEDGTPLANTEYTLIAPDGEFMNGEITCHDQNGLRKGTPIHGRTDVNGNFTDNEGNIGYPNKSKGPGIYTLEIHADVFARKASEPISAAKGPVVCVRIEAGEAGAASKAGGAVPLGGFIAHTLSVAGTQPTITPASNVVVVKKSYTNPQRQVVTLKVNQPFTGSGTFTRSNDAIRFFDAAVGGKEITFNNVDNVFTAAQLTAGRTLFAEGNRASAAVDDVELRLVLTVSGTPGLAATTKMTAVELTLDIFMSRTAAGVDPLPLPQPPPVPPAPGTATDKWFASRPVHLRSGSRGQRALLIVGKPKPAAFSGTLVLRQIAVSGTSVTGLDTKAKLFDTETGGAAKSNSHEFGATPIPASGQRFFVEGATLSGGLRDTGFQLGIKNVDNDGDRIALTVFSVDKIEAKLRATPCRRDGSRADVMPVKSSTADSKTFDATAITLVKEAGTGRGDLKLTATVRPAAIPLTWDVERAADDTGLAGLPAHSADSAAPLDNKKRVLKTDATGSFHVHAFVDVNANGKRSADEDGIILNVNMVNIEILPGAANNRIITRDTLFRDTRSTAAFLLVDSGSTSGGVPAVNAAYTDAEFAKHPLAMKVTVKLTGGGANQQRGTDKIGLGYIQQTPADSVTGTYADGRTLREVIVVSPLTPNPITAGAPARLAFPVRDTRFAVVSRTGPFIISSSDREQIPIAAGGQQRVVRFVDPPAIVINRTHPVTGSALNSIAGSNDFEVFLSAFSEDFNENYTVIATAAWSITYGTFTAGAGWTNAGAHVTAPGSMTALAKPTPGESTGVERCPPNFVDNLRMDATR